MLPTFIVSWGSWVATACMDIYASTSKTVGDLCRFYMNEAAWYITDDGRFFDGRFLDFSPTGLWYFNGNMLVHDSVAAPRKLGVLSLELTLEGGDVVGADEFLDTVRYLALTPPPVDVVMAALCIHGGRFMDWKKGTVSVFTKGGDSVTLKSGDSLPS